MVNDGIHICMPLVFGMTFISTSVHFNENIDILGRRKGGSGLYNGELWKKNLSYNIGFEFQLVY